MTEEGTPKSSFELAMERLRKKDADEGVTTRPMTDQQKAAIAEVKSLYESRIAEQDILQQSALNRMLGADPAAIEDVSRQFRGERERLASEREAKLEKIRRGDTPL